MTILTPYRDERSIKSIHKTASAKYAAREVEETVRDDGAKIGIVSDGPLEMVDTYFSDEEKAALITPYNVMFNGKIVISHDDIPVWSSVYDAIVTDPEALEFYYDWVMAHPDADLPFLGRQGLRDDNGTFEYAYSPHLDSKLVIGRFAVKESIRRPSTGQTVFNSFSTGGWTTP